MPDALQELAFKDILMVLTMLYQWIISETEHLIDRLAYLGSRVPVPINSNPAMVLREPAGSSGLWSLIRGSLRAGRPDLSRARRWRE